MLRGTRCDGVVLGHSVPHSLGIVVVDRISLGVILILNLGFGVIVGNIVSLGSGMFNIFLTHNGLSDIVTLSRIVGFSGSVGYGIALSSSCGMINTSGLSEVLLSCIVAIGCSNQVLCLSHHLGISEDIPLGDDPRLGIGSHGRCEGNSMGPHHSLNNGGIYGSWVCLGDSGIGHAGCLDILGHDLCDMLGVAVFHRGRGTVGCRRRSI